jgi:apolipoprotein N-acyltransferase
MKLGWIKSAGLALGAVVSFTLAYSISWGGFLILGFLYCLFSLAKFGTTRQAFYFGLAIGMLIYSLQLWFFYTIFMAAAIVLWLIFAFWLALFLLLAQLCFSNFKPIIAAILIPFLWTGVEYFRSELYYLRFSWLNVGYAFSDWQIPPFHILGVYGVGFLCAACVILFMSVRRKLYAAGITLLVFAIFRMLLPAYSYSGRTGPHANVVGLQLEFLSEDKVLPLLRHLNDKFPQTDLFVLSEYTFTGPVPEQVKTWCREHQRYLIVGGEDPTTNGNYYNTAFVIGTNGEVVFKQAKSVPIQFFKDGLPATEQKLWESPWGKIGICICYDLSYTRVTDELIRLGAQAIIVPTMDSSEWGRHQHELHARIAPVRAAEYGIPIFRLTSSGISQSVDSTGHVTASAPFPGEAATIQSVLTFRKPGSLPIDRMIAPISVFVTVAFIGWLAFIPLRRKRHPLKSNRATNEDVSQ